eukprot:4925378-Lingulodinium_polyedra.AAC.1
MATRFPRQRPHGLPFCSPCALMPWLWTGGRRAPCCAKRGKYRSRPRTGRRKAPGLDHDGSSNEP